MWLCSLFVVIGAVTPVLSGGLNYPNFLQRQYGLSQVVVPNLKGYGTKGTTLIPKSGNYYQLPTVYGIGNGYGLTSYGTGFGLNSYGIGSGFNTYGTGYGTNNFRTTGYGTSGYPVLAGYGSGYSGTYGFGVGTGYGLNSYGKLFNGGNLKGY